MTATSNKGYNKQTPGTGSGTWGATLNDEAWTYMDTNIGGTLGFTVGASNVTLTATQARYVIFRPDGTLSANVQVTNPAIGFYFVNNAVVHAGFALTWTNGVGSAITIPANTRLLLFADATNGVRVIGMASTTTPNAVPTGFETLFVQTAVPTGWTLKTTWNDYGLQLAQGTGGVTSGSVAYSTLFARTTVDGHTLTLAETVLHTHFYTANCSGDDGAPVAVAYWCSLNSSGASATAYTDFQGGGGAHDHTLDLRAQTLAAIIGVKS